MLKFTPHTCSWTGCQAPVGILPPLSAPSGSAGGGAPGDRPQVQESHSPSTAPGPTESRGVGSGHQLYPDFQMLPLTHRIRIPQRWGMGIHDFFQDIWMV